MKKEEEKVVRNFLQTCPGIDPRSIKEEDIGRGPMFSARYLDGVKIYAWPVRTVEGDVGVDSYIAFDEQ